MKFVQDAVLHTTENSNFTEDQDFPELALPFYFFFSFLKQKIPSSYTPTSDFFFMKMFSWKTEVCNRVIYRWYH